MRTIHQVCLAVSLLVVAVGCSHLGSVAQPLYPGPVLPAGETSLLSGYVTKVDGVDVSDRRGPFGVLPGCHVVEGQAAVGNDSPSGAWTAALPKALFAFRMQAGRSYEVAVRSQGSGSETHDLRMVGVEMDGNGKKLDVISPVRNKAEIASCQEWAAQQAPSPEPQSPAPPPAAQQRPSPEQAQQQK